MRSVLALTLGAAVAEAFMLSNGGVAAPALRARAPQVAAQSVPAGLVSRAAATPKARARLALRMSGLPAPADRPSPFEPDSDMARGARIPDGAYEELSAWLSVRPRRPSAEKASGCSRFGQWHRVLGSEGHAFARVNVPGH